MTKIDLKKKYKELFNGRHNEIVEIRVPEFQYLMIDGEGNPNDGEVFNEKVSSLYGLAYTVKFNCSRADSRNDFVVAPLEGLWWCDDMTRFSVDAKSLWKWTLMIMQPDFITEKDLEKAGLDYMKKKKLDRKPEIRLQAIDEAWCVQALHIGPYKDEAPLIAKMHDHIRDKGRQLSGLHHEIYLSNPQRTPPDRLKTLIRQPFI